MPDSIALTIGGQVVNLARSDKLLAVRSRVGMARSMEGQLRSMARRVPVERRGTLDGFELVEVEATASEMAAERSRLRGAAAVERATAVYHTSDDEVPFVPKGTIYLAFRPDAPDGVKEDLLRRYALELVAPEPGGFLTVRAGGSAEDAVEVAARLQRELAVATAEPDLVTYRRLDAWVRPSDEFLARQWHLENTGSHAGQSTGYKKGADARVVAAWAELGGCGSEDVVVAVIDDGFDLGHPDLAAKAVSPWDFARSSSDVTPEPDLRDPDAGGWHGTACAGVALGSAGGGQIVGAAPNARLMPIRMTSSIASDAVAAWFDYVSRHGAWIVSCSWSAEAKVYPLPDRISHAIARCARDGRGGLGCVVVFAAGNASADIDDPPRSQNGFATHPDVLAIGACTSMDDWSDYSNFGKALAVCAPSGGYGGWFVTTSDVRGTYLDENGIERPSGYVEGDYTHSFTGTSSACPLVAGVCALVLSANPALRSSEVRQILKDTARKIGPATEYEGGHSPRFGHGCVDAESAVREAKRRAPPGARSRSARGAVPNLFELVIAEALREEGATPQSIAAALASSEPFLRAIEAALQDPVVADDAQIAPGMVRAKLAKAFSASTAGPMFDRVRR